MAAERFLLSQSWWLASQLVRRHPEMTLIETHPGGGTYDCLTLIRDGANLVQINRVGSVHVHGGGRFAGMPIDGLLEHAKADEIVALVEEGAGLRSSRHTPASTPAVLSYRVLAQVMAMTVNDKHRWDVRNERIDSSGMDGGGRLGAVANFPIAAKRAEERRPDDLLGDPFYRFWGVLRDGEPVAVADTDGTVYVGQQVLHLPTLYQAHSRRLAVTAAAALATVLP